MVRVGLTSRNALCADVEDFVETSCEESQEAQVEVLRFHHPEKMSGPRPRKSWAFCKKLSGSKR